jgi:adenylate kinase
MSKRVILITGTPCVGKTTAAKKLAAELNATYVNLTELATHENLTIGKDKQRNTTIIDEQKMKERISQLIRQTDKTNIVIDGHYAVNVVPSNLVTQVFVLRRDPIELRKLMRQCGFSEQKQTENLAAEILDVCLVDALNLQKKGRICELNVTGKQTQEIVNQITDLLEHPEKCCVGVVDWLDKLETEGLLDEYLKI